MQNFLEFIEVKNFQSHENTRVDLHPGMNVFIGESNVGKTAIMRAEELVRTNRPNNPAKVSRWARKRNKAGKIELTGRMEITIGKSDKQTITRFRDSKENGYCVNGQVLKGEVMRAKLPPSEVTQALNLTDVNIAKQHDPHFFLSWSAPDISKYLNDLCGMDILDRCQSLAVARKNEAKGQLDLANAEVAEQTKILESLQWVDSAQAVLKQANAELLEASKNRDKAKAISLIVDSAKQTKATVAKFAWVENASELLNLAKLYARNTDNAWRRFSTISRDIRAASEAQRVLDQTKNVEKCRVLLEKAKSEIALRNSALEKSRYLAQIIHVITKAKQVLSSHLDIESCSDHLTKAKAAVNRAKRAKADAIEISQLIQNAKGHLLTISALDKTLERQRKELEALKEKQKTEAKKCPTCGQALPQHKECL